MIIENCPQALVVWVWRGDAVSEWPRGERWAAVYSFPLHSQSHEIFSAWQVVCLEGVAATDSTGGH